MIDLILLLGYLAGFYFLSDFVIGFVDTTLGSSAATFVTGVIIFAALVYLYRIYKYTKNFTPNIPLTEELQRKIDETARRREWERKFNKKRSMEEFQKRENARIKKWTDSNIL